MKFPRDWRLIGTIAIMKCPLCGSSRIRRSRVRLWEAPFKAFTRRRPYRCQDCRWRGWLVRVHHKHGGCPRLHTAEATIAQSGEPDLTAMDGGLPRK